MPNLNAIHSDQAWGKWFLIGIAIYFMLQVVIRSTGSIVLELDEAEQVVHAQWWMAGYSGQPPLYAWLQAAMFQLLGVNLWALSLVKNVLLFATYLFVFLSARKLLNNELQAVLVALSLFLFPQISWESQRDLTHSVLVTAMAAGSFYVVLRWLDQPNLGNYLLVGLMFGLGLLSKYNYVVFASVIILLLISYAPGRAVLFRPKILFSIAIAFIVIAPHGWWFLQSQELSTQTLDKLAHGGGLYPFTGFVNMLLAVLGFLAPWLIVMAIVFRISFVRAWVAFISHHFPLQRYVWFVFLLLVLLVLGGISGFKDRWMLPLLFLFPLVIFAAISPILLTPKRALTYALLCLLLPVLVLIFITARFHTWPLSEPLGTRHFYPFDEWVNQIEADGFSQGLIVSDKGFVAGNLKFRLQDSEALILGVNPANIQCFYEDGLLVAWDATRQPVMPQRLERWLNEQFNLVVNLNTVTILELPADRGYKLGVWRVPAFGNPLC